MYVYVINENIKQNLTELKGESTDKYTTLFRESNTPVPVADRINGPKFHMHNHDEVTSTELALVLEVLACNPLTCEVMLYNLKKKICKDKKI